MNFLRKAKYIVLELLSFGTPRAIVFNTSLIFLILAAVPTHSVIQTHIPCLFKDLILPFVFKGNCPETGFFAGCECPACGMTTALSRLMHGDFKDAWRLNKLVFLVFFIMLCLLAVNLIKTIRFYKRTRKTYDFE